MPRREPWSSAALQLTLVPAGQGQKIGECRGLLEARKRLEEFLEVSSSRRDTDHKKLTWHQQGFRSAGVGSKPSSSQQHSYSHCFLASNLADRLRCQERKLLRAAALSLGISQNTVSTFYPGSSMLRDVLEVKGSRTLITTHKSFLGDLQGECWLQWDVLYFNIEGRKW